MRVFSFASRSIGQRLAGVLGLVLLISFTGSSLGYWALAQAARETRAMYTDSLATERLASDWYRNISAGVFRTTAIAASSDSSLADFFAASAAEASKQSSELQKALDERMQSPAERAAFDKLTEVRKDYIAARDAISAARKAGDADQAKQILETRFKPLAVSYQDNIKNIVQAQRDELDAAAQRVEAANSAARTGLIVFALCALGVGGVLSAWLSRSITRPLREAGEVADAIARFDLTRPITVRGQDETSRLMQSLQTMQAALLKLIGEVRGSTESISTASTEIAVGNQDLSSRTEQTAANLQQAAASMTQLTGTVRQTAAAASTANQLASSATEVAQRGGRVVSEVVATMEEISHSSKKINDIIGVIDGIAFQTNILALNAAVEAARAGEQGRGFAVVASEVRSLAQRSAGAAKEIKALIGASVERVESGTQLVQNAGATMTEIVTSVQRVTDIIAEISAASHEQSDGIGQINVAVTQLDDMTQQNAALVEESAAAAESLRGQSGRLQEAIAVFRLHDGAKAPAPAAWVPAPAVKPRGVSPAAAVKPALKSPLKAGVKAAAKPAVKVAAAPVGKPVPSPSPAASGSTDDWESF
ncbi:methyl-accepting chemotaxis protein [Rhizobacter sp. Root1221]|uniref:methyl-accepting chemotaxis protein n=1 Tax=Rhizobacter sp. Root1221 TaxID=1736433 RepID=UPI0006FB6ECE|nr:methyl-accepting chemotaxis protein [Rhizobacter sp. Root1221]KQW01572.1 hypothetical protein ASC87_14660 [Rhizobacter sp. Root1221]